MSPHPRRALVIGGSGFLGSRLLALAPPDVEVTGTGFRRPVRSGGWRELQLDVTASTALGAALERVRPDAVFFCAYDRTDPAVTVDAACAAARQTMRRGARFVFFSSDLVFDGRAGGYTEESLVAPVSPFGAMKSEAEAQIRIEHPAPLIIRTALLVGESGGVVRPAYECEGLLRGQPVTLYTDEWRSPTFVDDVARAAWALCATELAGVFHVAGPERLSRLELGKILCAIFRFDARLLREGTRPPDRPRDTSLDSSRAAGVLGWGPRRLTDLARAPLAASRA